MLVLGRYRDERIFINGGEIVITVVSVGSGHVRLGFEAGPEFRINREEVQERIERGEEPKDRGRDGR